MDKRVVQVSIDIVVNSEDKRNFEQVISQLLRNNNFNVIGSDDRDMTTSYLHIINEVSQFVQNAGFVKASQAIDCEYEL